MSCGGSETEPGVIRVGLQRLGRPGSLSPSCQTPACHRHFDIQHLQTLSSSLSALILHATAILSPASQ